MNLFDLYKKEGVPLVILAGRDYGTGSSRDWAAKGTLLLGVRAVIAESFERIHRSNLVGMGVLPLQLQGSTLAALGLEGSERLSLALPATPRPGDVIDVQVDNGKSFKVLVRFDTEVDVTYFRNGGILNYMVRKML